MVWNDRNILPQLGAETGIFQNNKVNTMTVHALAPRIARPSATMILTIQGHFPPPGNISFIWAQFVLRNDKNA